MRKPILRRDFLKLGTAAAAGSLLTLPSEGGNSVRSEVQKPLRLLHMTDAHLMDFMNKRGSSDGIAAAYQHALTYAPDLILNGGDMLTHSIERPLKDMVNDAKTFLKLAEVASSVPMINACGNHDIWGWDKRKSGATGREALYGKAFFREFFGQGRTYLSVDLGRWALLVLDSTQPFENGYQGGLDDEQFEWLVGELTGNARGKPVVILTHIPVLSMAVVLTDARLGRSDVHAEGIVVPKGSSMQDAWRVVEAFRRHGGVRCVLSGHVHMGERVEVLGTTHIGGGAVCGSWWQPAEQVMVRTRLRQEGEGPTSERPPRAEPGFGVLDLHSDGSFEYEYARFPWNFRVG
ncbi:MAG: metallophosphoesterase family protein [Puniceicoccaceae bacterium]